MERTFCMHHESGGVCYKSIRKGCLLWIVIKRCWMEEVNLDTIMCMDSQLPPQ